MIDKKATELIFKYGFDDAIKLVDANFWLEVKKEIERRKKEYNV